MHDDSRDARLWDAAYMAGQRDHAAGRNLLAGKYAPVPDNVIDLHLWRVSHGRCACEKRRKATGGVAE